MPTYVTLTYTADVDWSAPEQAAELAEYGDFGQAAAAVIRGGVALYPTATATTVRVRDGKGGAVEAAAMDLLDPAGDVPHRTASSATTCSGWCSPAATRACPWRPRSPSASGPCAG